MQRRFERDEMYRVIFDTNNLDKKINFENDNNLDYIYITNGKSGITDKPCSKAQAKRSIVIINAALFDDNVKFRIKKTSEYFAPWKISQDEIFKNALTYLESKGITIRCTYRNSYDIKLLKKFIAKIFCEYVIPAIYYPNANDIIEDNDDISVPFVKMVDDINKLLLNTSISDIIYDLAETNELLRVKDNFIINPKEHKISTINNTSYFVIPFNIDYRITLKIRKDRFIEELGVIFEPTCDIESDPFQMFLPKYFIYVSEEEQISKEQDSELKDLRLLKASRSFRDQTIKEIQSYYVCILEHIIDYSNRILSIDYGRLYDDSIDSVEKLEEAFHDFKINCQELWDYLRDSRISPRGSVNFILELLKQSISMFCRQIYLFCENMIVLSTYDIDNNAHNANKDTKENLILDVLPENEYLDEFLENIDDENDVFLSNDLNSNTETYEPVDHDDTSKAIENNSHSESFFNSDLFKMVPNRATKIIDEIILLAHNRTSPKVNKLYDEIKKFIEIKHILVYRNKIETIIKSKRLAQMIEICKNDQTKTNYLIKSLVRYKPLDNVSLMYLDALIGGDEDCSYTESKKDTVFNYNMYEDLQCALSRLYNQMNGINL